MKNRAIIIIFICISFLSTSKLFAQGLQLDEILKIYSLDSIKLKEFCITKQFQLVLINEDNWIVSYQFISTEDNKTSFVRTFPKDNSDQIFLYYYFNDDKDYVNLKKALKLNKFRRFRNYDMFPQNLKISDQREAYVKKRLELELSTSNFGQNKYTLLLYKRVNF